MEILGSLSLGGANGNDSFRLMNCDDDMAVAGIMLDCAFPVTVGTAATPTATDLANVLKYFFAQFSLAYGPSQNWKSMEGIDGSELRNIFRYMALKEVPNNFVGVAQTLGAKTWVARLPILFSPVYTSGRPRWAGSDLVKTIRLDVSEGNVLTAGTCNITRTAGNAVVNVVPMYRKQKGQSVGHLPHFRRINQSRLDVETPPGLTLAVWDDNAAFAATAIGKYLARLGNDEVITNVPPGYINDEWSAFIDAGGSSVQDAETLLYFVDPFMDLERAPHGRAYIKLLSQDVSTIKARAIFYPDFEEAHAAEWAKYLAQSRKEAVLLRTADAMSPDAHPGYAATAPVEVIASSDNAFQTSPGILGTADGQVHLSIPQQVTAAVTANVDAAHPASKEAARTAGVHAIAKRVPGAVDASGKRRGGELAMQGIHQHFAAHGSVNQASK